MGSLVVVVIDVGFEGASAGFAGAEDAPGVELVVVDAMRAFDLSLQVRLADGCELTGDAFFAQLAFEGVLRRDVWEHGIGEFHPVIGLDLEDADFVSLEEVQGVTQEPDGIAWRDVFVDIGVAQA